MNLSHLSLSQLPNVGDPLDSVTDDEDSDNDEADVSQQHFSLAVRKTCCGK